MKLFLILLLAFWIGSMDWSWWVELPLIGMASMLVFDL